MEGMLRAPSPTLTAFTSWFCDLYSVSVVDPEAPNAPRMPNKALLRTTAMVDLRPPSGVCPRTPIRWAGAPRFNGASSMSLREASREIEPRK